jgi:hypothetical protein
MAIGYAQLVEGPVLHHRLICRLQEVVHAMISVSPLEAACGAGGSW